MFVMRYPRTVLAVGLLAALFVTTVTASQRQAAAMASAANALLSGLSAEQRQQMALPFDNDERVRWHYVPNETFPRKGLMVKAMSEAQRAQALALLKTGLSQKGYLTATAIMELENVLRAIESGTGDPGAGGRQFARDPLEYFFTIFGTPSGKGAWAWRVNGHHLSLQFTVEDGKAVATSPAFFGSNPAQVLDGPKKGLRVLAPEEDAGRALVLALDEAQRATATIPGMPPGEIQTANKPAADPLNPIGINSTAMTPPQRELLMKLIDVYVSYMSEDAAKERMEKLRAAGLDKIAFAWAGETQPGQKHYYRVQGPTFLIEFDDVQNNGNHIHSVWRDFKGDFGRDLLGEHLAAFPH
jgi:type II secretory pathway pseudopilin PulG